MIVKPKVRAFVCVTSHPTGCEAHVNEQIEVVKNAGISAAGPKNVLVIGASTGYGLASRIVAAFGYQANTIGVFFERPSHNGKTATAGYYNTVGFENAAAKAGVGAWSVNGDAFSPEIKDQVANLIQEHMGKVDLVIYSLAAPRRTDPATGEVFKSALKPIGNAYSNKYLDTDKRTVEVASLDPATDEEIAGTVKVMGGEDWKLWMDLLQSQDLLADGVLTVAYDYIGPKVTWPIYYHGTIGKAKVHLNQTAKTLTESLSGIGGRALVSVNKAVVTQASSAIPGVNLYITLLFKIMKEKGLHEGVIEQIVRLFRDRLFAGDAGIPVDEEGRVRVDDWEMKEEVQSAIEAVWDEVTTETLDQYTDFAGYRDDFLRLFGFNIAGVNYEEDVEIEVDVPSLKG